MIVGDASEPITKDVEFGFVQWLDTSTTLSLLDAAVAFPRDTDSETRSFPPEVACPTIVVFASSAAVIELPPTVLAGLFV
jgi:hypothetical protein